MDLPRVDRRQSVAMRGEPSTYQLLKAQAELRQRLAELVAADDHDERAELSEVIQDLDDFLRQRGYRVLEPARNLKGDRTQIELRP